MKLFEQRQEERSKRIEEGAIVAIGIQIPIERPVARRGEKMFVTDKRKRTEMGKRRSNMPMSTTEKGGTGNSRRKR